MGRRGLVDREHGGRGIFSMSLDLVDDTDRGHMSETRSYLTDSHSLIPGDRDRDMP